MGKSGLIARKIAATLCSTGTAAHFLHPAEALHGDLGMIAAGDLVVALSAERGDGRGAGPAARAGAAGNVLSSACAGRARSTLAQASTVWLDTSVATEAGER